MAITHVVRGDDHISNTPKQVLLYQAMGAPVPAFAHVPLILGPDKKRLSKRHGATSVGEYEKQGYLPEAMVNFLALLGWSPGGDQRGVHARRAGRARSRSRASAAATRSSTPRSWTGSTSSTSCGCRRARFFAACGRRSRRPVCGARRSPDRIAPGSSASIDLVKPRAQKLTDLVEQLRPFLLDVDRARRRRGGEAPERARILRRIWRRGAIGVRDVTPFDAATLEAALRTLADARGIKPGALIHATRVAVTGQAVSPGIFEVLELMGRDRVVSRLADALS